ncbi:MAG: sugar phosphate isomerase/epimerase [Oscillospiraceae bacterium]|jgi:sugar phosphate isomerase/epimerase|nr:sugar phosphate isomerase/epimerase [Oscillospiraceae bacterium]
MKFAVQLYSLRGHVKTGADLLALFPKIKALGFDGVEFAGYVNLEAAVLRKALDDAGLVAVGTHIGLENYLPENLEATLSFCKTLGMKYAGVGGAPHGTPEEAAATAAVYAAARQAAADEGIVLYYHNHCGEFEAFDDGSLAIDVIKEACPLELDTYWSFCAGVENESYIKQNKEHICLVHIKDGINHKPKALGEGECDLAAVVRGAKAIGLEWLVLENDDPEPDGLSDIARSMVWLKANASTLPDSGSVSTP